MIEGMVDPFFFFTKLSTDANKSKRLICTLGLRRTIGYPIHQLLA